MVKCSKNECQEAATFECICGTQKNFYCNYHLSEHKNNYFLTHYSKMIESETNPEVKKIVLSGLEGLLKKLSKSKQQLLEEVSKMIILTKERSNVILSQISKSSKKLKGIIKIVSKEPGGLPDCQIRDILKKDFSEAQTEINSWKNIFSFSIENEKLIKAIQKNIILKNNIDILFTSEKRILNQRSSVSIPFINPACTSENYQITYSTRFQQPLNLMPSIPRVTIKCEQRHELTWSIFIPYQYFLIVKNFYFICDICKKKFSCSSWNCFSCKFDICEKCGLKFGQPCPKLKCSNDHELLWRPDTCCFYQSIGKSYSFTCQHCKVVKVEPCWSCRGCCYEICKSCAKDFFNYEYLKYSLLCPSGHLLEKEELKYRTNQVSTNISLCNECQMYFEAEALVCIHCQWKLCPNCAKSKEKSLAGHPILTCRNLHLMTWDGPLYFKCDSCYRLLSDEMFCCKTCQTFLCLQCSGFLLEFVVKNKEVEHQEGHTLSWYIEPCYLTAESFVCYYCKGIFNKIGIFSCDICKIGFCILCSSNNFRFD